MTRGRKLIITKPDTPEREIHEVSGPVVAGAQVLGDAWYIGVPDNATKEQIEEYLAMLEKTPDWGNSDELEALELRLWGTNDQRTD